MSGRVFVAAALLTASLTGCAQEARVTFSSCKEAQEAGVHLPLTKESPGWNPKLDRDRDGKAC